MEIRSLAETDFTVIFDAFEKAFSDYEMQLDIDEFCAMIHRRGYDPALSFAAFDNGDIVSFTLNGTGIHNGIRTAYDTGTGTRKEYRGQGLATRIFEYSIPFLKAEGIHQYLLEVLQHNTNAVSVYRNLGFEESREFYYFRPKLTDIKLNPITSNEAYRLESLDIATFGSFPDFGDFIPSWQNSRESIKRAAAGFIGWAVWLDNKPVGYCIFEPSTGDIAQLAVGSRHRQNGIGTMLFEEIFRRYGTGPIKIINTETTCDSINDFLKSKGIEPTGKQFEMIKKLYYFRAVKTEPE